MNWKYKDRLKVLNLIHAADNNLQLKQSEEGLKTSKTNQLTMIKSDVKTIDRTSFVIPLRQLFTFKTVRSQFEDVQINGCR